MLSKLTQLGNQTGEEKRGLGQDYWLTQLSHRQFVLLLYKVERLTKLKEMFHNYKSRLKMSKYSLQRYINNRKYINHIRRVILVLLKFYAKMLRRAQIRGERKQKRKKMASFYMQATKEIVGI